MTAGSTDDDVDFAALIKALVDRKSKLRVVARWLGRAAVVLLAGWLMFGVPYPGGDELFGMAPQGRYSSIPPELATDLTGKAAGIKVYSHTWDKQGAGGISPWGIYLLGLLGAHLLAKRMFPSVRTRLKLLFISPPLFLLSMMLTGGSGPATATALLVVVGAFGYAVFCYAMSQKAGRMALFCVLPGLVFTLSHLIYSAVNLDQSMGDDVFAAHAGTISDKPDAMPAATGDSEARMLREPMVRKVAKDGTVSWGNVPDGYVAPYHLQPGQFEPVLADQAHYVLAQQAYLASDAEGTARHLRSMSGAWRPEAKHTRGRIGAMADWSRLHAANPGNSADRIAGGAPYIWPRYIAGTASKLLGCLLGTFALICLLLAGRLKSREDFFRDTMRVAAA